MRFKDAYENPMVVFCKIRRPSETKCTYNLAFFLGPGLPRGFGSPSGPNDGPAARFTPFFLGISDGGGMSDAFGVPAATGVLELDSDGLSPLGLMAAAGAAGWLGGAIVGTSFDGDSSLTRGTSINLCRILGDTFNLIIIEPFDDFRRTAEGVEVLVIEAIVMLMGEGWMVWFGRKDSCRV